MKILVISLICCFILYGCKRNESYSSIIERAKKLSQDEDSVKQWQALNVYEKAFTKYPDSVDDYSMYDASVIASKIKDLDKAFKYLTPLSELIEDEEGYPGWDFVLGDYADEDYENLKTDPRWSVLKEKALINKDEFFKNLKKDEKEFFEIKKSQDLDQFEAEPLYNYLKTSNNYLVKKKQNYSISFKINDTASTSYYVHLPKTYHPENKNSVLFFLHGAVRFNTLSEYETKSNLKYYNRFYTKYADANNVILIFPKGNKHFNWMLPDDGFFIVPEILKQLKTTLNINDNKVFISGHSNGATGSFSYVMKKPTPFAGFYGFNTEPKVYTGGTFIENVLTRSFINFSTDQDYYYPPNANDSLNKLMADLKADYKEYRYEGFPHWFPEFDESEPAYEILFEDLLKRERNPYPKSIQWEFDDNDYGTVDWLSELKLDTLKSKKPWHRRLNFNITKRLKYNESDSLVEIDVDEKAFDFPRKSGKVIAVYGNNEFNIKTSRVKSFILNIAPEMVDLNNKVKVYVNEKLYFNDHLDFNREVILNRWKSYNDRERLWVNELKVYIN